MTDQEVGFQELNNFYHLRGVEIYPKKWPVDAYWESITNGNVLALNNEPRKIVYNYVLCFGLVFNIQIKLLHW